MPELGDELRLLADQGAQQARPIPSAEVMACGDPRRRRRVMRGGVGAGTGAAAVRGRPAAPVRGRRRRIGYPGGPAGDPAPPRDPAPGPAAITRADPAGAHAVTGAQSPAYTVAVAVVRAGPAGLHTFSVAAPDGLTQPLANPVGVPAPQGNAWS